ncbi:MAG: DUF3667 domain-containing protein [Chitinophagales bacterium]|nr:DUF3667 domain-containing protein [Chitinophagales bacterium]
MVSKCLNCSSELRETDSFCPSCGQSTKKLKTSFWTLLQEFFGDLFAFDSKFFKSLFPLLFRPGFLSRKYSEGKRASYIPPLRLYIFISFIYFLLLSYMTSSTRVEFLKLDEDQVAQIDSLLSAPANPDSTISMQTDTVYNAGEDPKMNFSLSEGSSSIAFADVVAMEKSGMDPEAIADTIGFESKVGRIAIANVIKLYRTQGAAFFPVLLNSASWMMFVLIPVFALIMKLLYLRSGYYYLEHMIFGFHFHAFVFIALLALLFIGMHKIWTPVIIILILLYLFLAMLNAYKQSIWITSFKYFGLIWTYAIVFFIFAFGTSFISFVMM